jgi:acyl-CoA reductase-like NAD-dependent aldehyde dehydrogenase
MPGEWQPYFTPTVIAGATSEMLLCSEETFGPDVPLFCFESHRTHHEHAASKFSYSQI